MQRLAKPWFRRPLIRIFRDETSLSANPGLWSELERSLAECRHFILLASPRAAASPWVQREVSWWLAHRPIDTLFVVVTEGALQWDAVGGDFNWTSTTCLPSGLQRQFSEEPLYVDLTWAKGANDLSLRHSQFRAAVLDLAAPLHNRPKDELDSEDIRQHRRLRVATWSAVSAIVLLAVASIVAAWRAVENANEALRNAMTATSRQHAVQAQLNIRDGSLSTAVTSALTAWRTEDTAEARAALFAALEAAWDVHAVLRLHQAAVEAIVFRDDDRELLTWSRDGVLAAWDVATRRPLRVTRGMPLDVGAALFSADGNTLVTGLADGSIVLWDTATLERRLTLPHQDQSDVMSLAFDRSGRLLAAGYRFNGELVVWDVDRGLPESVKLEMPVSLSFEAGVTGVSFSADGRYLAAANHNPSAAVGVWEWPSGRLVAALNPSTSFWSNLKVTFLSESAIGEPGTYLSIASSDGRVQIFREASSAGRTRFERIGDTMPHQGTIGVTATGGGSLATGGADGAVSMWADANARPILPASWARAAISALEYNSDGTLLAAGAGDGTVVVYYGRLARPRLYDEVLTRLEGPDRSADGQWLLIDRPDSRPTDRRRSLARASTGEIVIDDLAGTPSFSDDGRWMIVTQPARTTLWDLASGDFTRPVLSGVAGASLSPRSRFLVLAPQGGGEMRLVDLTKTPVVERAVRGADRARLGMFSPGESVALLIGQEELRLVDTATGNLLGGAIALEPLSDDEDDVYRFSFSADDRWLIAGRSGGTSALHRVGPSPGGPLPLSPFRGGQFSPDGKWLLVQESDGHDAMWNLAGRSRLFTAPRPMYWAHRFSPDSRWFVRKNAEGRAEVWDLQAPSAQAQPLTSDPVSDIQTSPDGRFLVTLGDLTAKGRRIDVWQLEGAAPAHAFSADSVRDLEFTADGRWLLALDARDDTTIVWDLASRMSHRLKASLNGPHELSADGRLFAIADVSTLTLADLATPAVQIRLEGHSKRLSDVAFSPDGRTLASVDADGSLILWDLTSRRRLGETLIGPGEGEESRYRVSFAPHGLSLDDGIPVHPVTWIEDICRRIDPALPSAEWQRLVGGGAYPQACDAIEGVTPGASR